MSSTGTKNFYGTFDGNNNVICSLYENINTDENIIAGLFSTSYGEIKNLGLVDTDINIKGIVTTVGGIVGCGYNNINNCYVTGKIVATGSSWMPVGGLCGVMQEEANIENCYNLADINVTNIKEDEGDADIGCGGIVGQGFVNLNRCFNKGNILADGGNNMLSIGGICGHSDQDVIIQNCYNTGRIEGIKRETSYDIYVAGIIGHSNCSILEYCYNLGEIVGNGKYLNIAGIIARKYANGEINNVFNIGSIVTKGENIRAAGGIIGQLEGTSNHININNAYNIGKIEAEKQTEIMGSIAGTNWSDVMTYNNCFYLAGTCDVGVDFGNSTGIKELQNISEFPSVLKVVNGGAFKEDVNNINNGYPILDWQ